MLAIHGVEFVIRGIILHTALPAYRTILGEILPRRHTGLAADMLAPICGPLSYHNTAASPAYIPRLAAPTAVPCLVLGLKGTVWKRALGKRVARRGRVWDGLFGGVAAGAAVRETDYAVSYVR
ncbi:unnamed protein product [Fusarium graminearum]|uniref:Uncharacterized protein n=1 Tax=Gibberella zeae TaxID=5518 RepID=A0A9N8RAR3_GIBZA|nr:unnamed protein product [Fusarium graminearum]CAF3611394.1 unnamed protein product [Fusarium graminearum]CAG1981047.1 unnamed protein product [Fusarium graminearum]